MVILYKQKAVDELIKKLKSQHQKELNKLKESQQGWKDARDRLDIMYDSLKLENQKLTSLNARNLRIIKDYSKVKKELNDLKEVFEKLRIIQKRAKPYFDRLKRLMPLELKEKEK